jgi:uncharacterized protein YggE
MVLKNVNANAWLAAGVVLAAVLVVKFAPAPSVPGQISVVGECIRKVGKDRTSIVLEIRNLEKDAAAATRKSTGTYRGISEYVVALGEKHGGMELETTRMDTYEKVEWNQALKKNVKLGVESIVGLEVSTGDQALVSEILVFIAKYKDVYTNGLRAYASKELLKKEQDDCIAEAVLDARAKAEKIAASGSQRLGEMVSAGAYRHGSGDSSPIAYRAKSINLMAGEALAGDGFAPSIFRGTSDISVAVGVSFEIK